MLLSILWSLTFKCLPQSLGQACVIDWLYVYWKVCSAIFKLELLSIPFSYSSSSEWHQNPELIIIFMPSSYAGPIEMYSFYQHQWIQYLANPWHGETLKCIRRMTSINTSHSRIQYYSIQHQSSGACHLGLFEVNRFSSLSSRNNFWFWLMSVPFRCCITEYIKCCWNYCLYIFEIPFPSPPPDQSGDQSAAEVLCLKHRIVALEHEVNEATGVHVKKALCVLPMFHWNYLTLVGWPSLWVSLFESIDTILAKADYCLEVEKNGSQVSEPYTEDQILAKRL